MAGPWIGEETHAEAVGLSHIQDLRPRDSGCRLAPVTCGSRDLESRSLPDKDYRCATDPGHRFVNGGKAPEHRCR